MPFTTADKSLEPVWRFLPPTAAAAWCRAANIAEKSGADRNACLASGWAEVRKLWHQPKQRRPWQTKPVEMLKAEANTLGTRTLYVDRPVLNADPIIAWATKQGFPTTLPAGDMHVTLAFSRAPVDWNKIAPRNDTLTIPASASDRVVKPLGPQGATVLRFDSPVLTDRWAELCAAGASWDFPSFQPHTTITYDRGDLDLDTVDPYNGIIELGAERFAEVNDDWATQAKAKLQATTKTIREHHDMSQTFETSADVVKVDQSLGLVFGFAVVCKVDGVDYFDVQDDHIPEDAMVKAALDFMLNSRMGCDSHARDDAGGPVQKGEIAFAFPLTSDIAKALEIDTRKTGLLIGYRPGDEEVLRKYRSGEYTGFSIGGRRITDEIVAP